MRPQTYFSYTAFLPLVLPYFLYAIGGRGVLGIILYGAFLMTVVPYSVFSVAMWAWWRRAKDFSELIDRVALAPVIFCPVFFLSFWATSLWNDPEPLTVLDAFPMFIGLSLLVLLFGYFYFLVALAGYGVLKKLGYIIDEQPQP